MVLAPLPLNAQPAPPTAQDSRVQFEQAGQLLVALQSKPPASRTRADYTQTIEAYRQVYHLAPTSVRADPSAYSVAELTEEMGHRFHDTAALQQAVKQYRFLLREYPATKHRAESLLAIGNIESEDLNDRSVAREAYEDLLKHFPSDPAAAQARTKLAGLDRDASGAKSAAAEVQPSAAPALTKAAAKTDSAGPPQSNGSVVIKGVRHWSTPEYTRIAIDLDQQVQYEVGEVPGPERVFFDLKDAKIAAGPAGKSYEINDGLVKRVRVAVFKPHVTRVVVELSAPADYSPFILPNPWRIMIEIKPRHPAANLAQRKGATERIVAEPFTLSGGKPVTSQAKAANADESMVVVVPMKKEAAAPGPQPTRQAVAQASESDAAPHPTEAASRQNTTTPIARPAKAPVVISDAATPAAADRAREAKPTSSGERSLTRALGLKIGRIVIDAGHGGHDTGTIGPTGYCEKDLVLDVALRLGKLLEQKMGAEVIYTRDDDTFIPLEERTEIANHAGADLFLSIHANSSPDPNARGVETYYLNFSASDEALEVAARENATSQKTVHELQDLVKNIALKEKIEESREFAADVQHALWQGEVAKSPGIKNRGVKKAPFIVLIGAHMPSVLAEISFVSNAGDERRLRTPDYRQRIAESLYRGISRYAGGLSGIKFAANSSFKPSGQTVAGTPATPAH